ncbi:MAG: zf-HC2 domain-containing protein [Pyrinomonadaceae bacterium]
MRCEDCLPLIEEYFDGEVTGQTATSVRAHLAACADCAAALDALSFEQEIYARYDRGGLEVTPDLWARVSAEIARTPPPEVPNERRPFLSRARQSFAAALGAHALRPALASTLALLIVAAAAGTLWLARRPHTNVSTGEVAQTAPAPAGVVSTPAPNNAGDRKATTGTAPFTPNESINVPAVYVPRESETAQGVRRARPEGDANISVEQLLAESSAPKASPGLVPNRPDEHAGTDDIALLLSNPSAPSRNLVQTDAPLLDPDEKDVARHVERAQMLLRSIKNVRAGEAGDTDIAYEQSLSRKLLAENATLQLEAEVKGDKESKQVLDRIEPFLLDIANMGDKPTREEVRSIRDRVRSNEIVAALEVY